MYTYAAKKERATPVSLSHRRPTCWCTDGRRRNQGIIQTKEELAQPLAYPSEHWRWHLLAVHTNPNEPASKCIVHQGVLSSRDTSVSQSVGRSLGRSVGRSAGRLEARRRHTSWWNQQLFYSPFGSAIGEWEVTLQVTDQLILIPSKYSSQPSHSPRLYQEHASTTSIVLHDKRPPFDLIPTKSPHCRVT